MILLVLPNHESQASPLALPPIFHKNLTIFRTVGNWSEESNSP